MEQGGGHMQKQALEGVRVLDIATVIAAPWAAGLLADFGAEVIKVEMTGRGDAFRAMGPLKDGKSIRWPSMGRNKKSVTLDFHYEEGKQLFLTQLLPYSLYIVLYQSHYDSHLPVPDMTGNVTHRTV